MFSQISAIALVFLLALAPVCASAQAAGNGNAIPTSQITLVAATTTTVIKTGPGLFFGVHSLGVQTTVVSCFDNTALSGTQVYAGTPTGASDFNAAYPINFLIGLTCAIATSIVAPGYLVLWR